MTLSQTFSFEAGHRLVDRPICREEGERIHGHSYFVEITISGEPERGMIMDSSLLKDLGGRVLEHLDHSFLNDIEGIGEPTIESIGRYIFERASERISDKVCSVRVWRPSVGDCAKVGAIDLGNSGGCNVKDCD